MSVLQSLPWENGGECRWAPRNVAWFSCVIKRYNVENETNVSSGKFKIFGATRWVVHSFSSVICPCVDTFVSRLDNNAVVKKQVSGNSPSIKTMAGVSDFSDSARAGR